MSACKMLGIATPLQCYQKLVQEFDDFCENPGSARHAMNFVITAYHLHEWVWKGFLKNDAAKRQELGIGKDIGAFKIWLDNKSIWYAQIVAQLDNANWGVSFSSRSHGTRVVNHRFHLC
jgi:hypothetical protein